MLLKSNNSLTERHYLWRSHVTIPLAACCALLTANRIGLGSAEAPMPAKQSVANDFNIVWQADKPTIADQEGHLLPTTLDPELQLRLQAFVTERNSPISAVVVSSVATGKILAMVQGRTPEKWGGTSHTALHARFPAASLFKTIVAAAAMEMTTTGADQTFGLQGGCGGQDIQARGQWINDDRGSQMTLRRAFGHSCNSFFAKLAINQLGLGSITRYARMFGWDQQLPTDFLLEPSKMLAPRITASTTHTVGRFAAGFGQVGISPIHANWIALALANKGVPKSLQLFESEGSNPIQADTATAIVSPDTASRVMDVMKSTVDDGTASNIFNRGRYRSVAQETGGKTGTLNGKTPAGLTTLFFGIYPLSRPQISVSAIVVLEDRYHFKASQLAAEAIVNWRDIQDQKNGIIHSAKAEGRESKRREKRRHRRF